MSIANIHPEAFRRGVADCEAYYARIYAGEIKEGEHVPPHPYQMPDEALPWSQRCETEWHTYNAGWFEAIPCSDATAVPVGRLRKRKGEISSRAGVAHAAADG